MKTVKAKSLKYINDHSLTGSGFEWQEGLGAFSYRQRDVDMIYKYILNQQEHHSKQTFLEEYLELLKEFEIGYDEQYIFQELVLNNMKFYMNYQPFLPPNQQDKELGWFYH